MDLPECEISPTRRRFFRLSLIPVAVAGLPGCSDDGGKGGAKVNAGSTAGSTAAAPYQATFFGPAEMAFLTAACQQLIPTDELGPGAVEAGVPEFLDRHRKTPYAAGDIWSMEGPHAESSARAVPSCTSTAVPPAMRRAGSAARVRCRRSPATRRCCARR